MAIQTGRWRPAADGAEVVTRVISSVARRAGERGRRVRGRFGVFAQRAGSAFYAFLTHGPLIRLVSKTLLRRIIFANLIGLAILLSGVFYLAQYRAGLIEAWGDSLRVQGESFASLIAVDATREPGTGRIVLNPDMLPEIEGAHKLLRDEPIVALQLSMRPEKIAPLFTRLPATTRARVYDTSGVLVADSVWLLKNGKLTAPDAPDPTVQRDGRQRVKTAWTRFMAWLQRGQIPVYREIEGANGKAYQEVGAALKGGESIAILMITELGQHIVSVATPIIYRDEVQGAVLLSTRPGALEGYIQGERFALLGSGIDRTDRNPDRFRAHLPHDRGSDAQAVGSRGEHQPQHRRAREAAPPRRSHRRDRADERRLQDDDGVALSQDRGQRAVRARGRPRIEEPADGRPLHGGVLAYVKTPEMREELVGQIQGELARLNRLISDVSAVSRLDAELAYGGSEPVDVRDVLRGVVAIFQDRCSSNTLDLVLDIQDRWLPADAFIVMGHEARLGRVITNLLDNAISFSPEGGVVAVCARRLDTAIEIIVDDDGPGIPDDKLDDIFERFYSDRPQSDSTLGKNSGLGLSISRDIVDAYGGCIEASNRVAAGGTVTARLDHPTLRERRQPGVAGTRFTVRLPAANVAGAKGGQQLARRA